MKEDKGGGKVKLFHNYEQNTGEKRKRSKT